MISGAFGTGMHSTLLGDSHPIQMKGNRKLETIKII